MQIDDFKTWHWVAVGLLAGLAFSLVLWLAGPPFATDDLDTIDAASFEHAVVGQLVKRRQQGWVVRFHPDQPVVRNVVVHPPLRGMDPKQYWVTGQLYDVREVSKNPADPKAGDQYVEQWRPFKYPAPTPYRGEVGAVGTFPTVAGYLAAAQAAAPRAKLVPVPYRLAWQELSAAEWSLPPAAGLLLIGVAWPLSLGILRRAGVAQPVRAKRPAPKPEPVPAPIPNTAGVRLAPPPPPPVPQPVQTEEDRRRYGGEFYPVVKPAGHE